MKRFAVAAAGLAVAWSASCGSFLEAPNDDPLEAGAGDGAPDGNTTTEAGAPDGSVPDGALVGPPSCPHRDCENEGDTCVDEDCDESSIDFETPLGSSVVATNGTCKVQATVGPHGMAHAMPRGLPRTNVVLSMSMVARGAGDGRIMSIGVASGGMHVAVVRRGNQLDLCQFNGVDRICSPTSVEFDAPTHVDLWGIVTSETPPRAKFALSAGSASCAPGTTIDLTVPFASGDIVGSVGCLEPTPTATCSMEFEDAVLLLRPE